VVGFRVFLLDRSVLDAGWGVGEAVLWFWLLDAVASFGGLVSDTVRGRGGGCVSWKLFVAASLSAELDLGLGAIWYSRSVAGSHVNFEVRIRDSGLGRVTRAKRCM
jgi:hypothetical protein